MQALVLHKIKSNFGVVVGPININEYKLVASISDLSDEIPDIEALEIVFDRTKSIEELWTSNEGVMVFGGAQQRSTSVGDIVYLIEDGNVWVAYQCAFIGWSIANVVNIK